MPNVTPALPPLSTRFRRKSDVLVRELEGEAVLLDLASGRYFGLNATGRRILELVDGERSLEAICTALSAEFEVAPTELAIDLRELVADLEREGLLVRIE